jgi:hypothetical protein
VTGKPSDDYRDRHIIGAPGCLFILGAVLPFFYRAAAVLNAIIAWTKALSEMP